MDTPSANSPQYRVTQNGLGEWTLESLDVTIRGLYHYVPIEVFNDRQSAVDALNKYKRDLAERIERASKRSQLVEVIY